MGDSESMLATARTNDIEHPEDVKGAVLGQDGPSSFIAGEERS